MKIIRNKNLWLPQEVRNYEDPVTGEVIKGDTFRQLVVKVRQRRLALGLETQTLEFDIEASICSRLPAGHGYCREAESERLIRKPLKQSYNWEDVKSFATSIVETFKRGEVSQEEADNRSETCKGCHYNVILPGCAPCQGFTRTAANTIFGFLGKKTVRQEDYLKQCGICGCALTAKVWAQYPKENPQVQKHLEDYPDWCWVRKS